MRKIFFIETVLICLVLFACEIYVTPGAETSYYWQSGGVSTAAYNLLTSNQGISAGDAIIYCNQYPVAGDSYRDAKTERTRNQLENWVNTIVVSGFSGTSFLRMLDSTGAAFYYSTKLNGDYVYYYAKKE
jgi:hypothetical protein